MKGKLLLGARLLFGLAFFIFGINGFLHFIPNPPMAPEAGALMGAFVKTGYFLPMIKIIEAIIGLMLLANLFVPLALVMVTPVLIGITTIHIFLNPAGIPIMLVLHLLHGFMTFGYKDYFTKVLSMNATLEE